MIHRFSLPGVTIRMVEECRRVASPFFVTDKWRIHPNEFEMEVNGVAHFYARTGKEVEICPVPGAEPEKINLYLYGEVLAALLHQRRVINFHASSFIFKDKGIMLLGDTGAGKSSLAASFILRGARFLSDDLTAVLFDDEKPLLWPVYKTIKLREESIRQLGIDRRKTRKWDSLSGKFYFRADHAGVDSFPLDLILIIETGEESYPVITSPGPTTSFSLLRSGICSWEMLRGMPETEEEYLHQLIAIVGHTKVFRVVRPHRIPIAELHDALLNALDL